MPPPTSVSVTVTWTSSPANSGICSRLMRGAGPESSTVSNETLEEDIFGGSPVRIAFTSSALLSGRVKVLRRMFKWAVENDYMEANPARAVSYIETKAGGYRTWTPDEVAQFEARWPIGTRQRLALAFLRYLGVRRSDVVRLGRRDTKNGWLRFTAKKGEKRSPVTLELPIPQALKDIIEQTDVCGIATFLTTDHGRPYSAAGFGIRFREWCDEAGLPGLSAHGLRKFAAVSLAEAGASAHQLMAWFGWRSLKEAERYTRAANQKKLAASAGVLIDGLKDGT